MQSAPRWIKQHSAGGVAVRRVSGRTCFLAIRPAGRERWQLPKGTVDPGETPEEAAVREVREEGGINCAIQAALPPIHYFYKSGSRRYSKTVDFYLMRFLDGDPADHDGEVEEALWVPFEEMDRLTFKSERDVVSEALTMLGEFGPEI